MPDGFLDTHSWWLTGARLEAESMQRYYETVHAAIHDGEADFRQRIQDEVDEDYREYLAEDFMERFGTYPRMLRYSQVVAIANTVEHELRTLGEMCSARVGVDFSNYAIVTQGWPREFARLHDYLSGACGYQIPVDNDWNFLVDAFILRNAIAHFGGHTDQLSSANMRNRAVAFANAQPNVDILPMLMADGTPAGPLHPVAFRPEFVGDLFTAWNDWLTSVVNEARRQGFTLP